MSRLWEILTRTPPMVAPAALLDAGAPALTFGFTARSELAGWTVTAYGPDGRQLGRPLKGLSESAQATLTRPVQDADPDELRALAGAWTEACRRGATNSAVLTGFADSARAIRDARFGSAG